MVLWHYHPSIYPLTLRKILLLHEAQMILHIYVSDKFIPPYVSFIDTNFPKEEHIHFIDNSNNRYHFEESFNRVIVDKLNFLNLFKLQSLFVKADKVIIHGLLWGRIVRFLVLNYKSLKKCYWVIWGGDLYSYTNRHKKLSKRLMHHVRCFVISRLGHFITYLPGDYERAQKWYGADGEYHECLAYLSNVFKPTAHVLSKSESKDIKNVLLGNSATTSNRHSEALKLLLPFKGAIRIYTPLTYGNKRYARQVIDEGNSLFGANFIPLTEHLPLEEYYRLLAEIDLVIFNHDRQQGMGNLIQLLALGKKVFINFSTPQKALFDTLGITVYDIETIDLDDLDEGTRSTNEIMISDYFSEARLKAQWQSIFTFQTTEQEMEL